MSDECSACHHPLRNHHIATRVLDNRAEFRCACGCVLDGTATVIDQPTPQARRAT
jgi:hypothetical protein